jgi:magnesium transporter
MSTATPPHSTASASHNSRIVDGEDPPEPPLPSGRVGHEGARAIVASGDGVRTRLYRSDTPPTDADLTNLRALCGDDENLLWIDLTGPADTLVQDVAALLGVDPRAAEIARRYNRRPVVRAFRDHYVVTAFSVDVDETGQIPRMTVTEITAVAGRNYLLSVHNRPLPFLSDLEERTAANPLLGRLDSSYLLYVLLDTLVSDYSREFEEVEDEVERLEERLLREPGRAALDDVMVMKRHIHAVRRILGPHRQAFGALVAPDSPVPAPQVESYFRDLVQHLDMLNERLDHARDTVTGSYNLYISNISHRTNQELRVLTFLSAVLLPMTVITGIFGTNFKLGEYEFYEGFYAMLIGMALISVGLLSFFRWRRWI